MTKSTRSASFLFIITLLLFLISSTFAFLTLRTYLTFRNDPLPPYPCKVQTSHLISCTPPFFTLRVTVFPYLISDGLTMKPNLQDQIVAYPTADQTECPFPSKLEAEQFSEGFQNGNLIVCYTGPGVVRLTPGYISNRRLSAYGLRLIFPMVAAVLSTAALIWSVWKLGRDYWKRGIASADTNNTASLELSRLRSLTLGEGVDEVGLQTPGRVVGNGRRIVSGGEAKRLVDWLKAKSDWTDGGVCPICLEEIAVGQGVSLLCAHGYHDHCILLWFRKGWASCPYCNEDVYREQNIESLGSVRWSAGRGWGGGESAMEVGRRDAGIRELPAS